MRCDGLILTQRDRNILLSGQMPSDKHIDFAQTLLQSQFPTLNGLQSILFQSHSKGFKSSMNALQIIHSISRGNHWIVATTLHCNPGEMKIFDSVYEYLDSGTLQVVKRLFDNGKELKVRGGTKNA